LLLLRPGGPRSSLLVQRTLSDLRLASAPTTMSSNPSALSLPMENDHRVLLQGCQRCPSGTCGGFSPLIGGARVSGEALGFDLTLIWRSSFKDTTNLDVWTCQCGCSARSHLAPPIQESANGELTRLPPRGPCPPHLRLQCQCSGFNQVSLPLVSSKDNADTIFIIYSPILLLH
jgi:hypothetical protein